MNYDKKELKMGIKIEMEHTDDPKEAEKIAIDHLKENPKYYSDLAKCMPHVRDELKEQFKIYLKNNLKEAKGGYNYIPTSTMEIKNLHAPDAMEADLIELFTFLTTINPSEPAPIALNKARPDRVKIRRLFFYNSSLKSKLEEFLGTTIGINIKKTFKFNSLAVAFGEGSRGNRGSNNTGNALEGILEHDLNEYLNGGTNFQQPEFITQLGTIINLDEIKYIEPEGGLNKARGFKVVGNKLELNNGNKNIGEIVSDVTVHMNNGTKHYLSVKKSGTVNFANLSIARTISEDQIINYDITNPKLQTILSFFGIDEDNFCAVFNNAFARLKGSKPHLQNDIIEDITSEVDISELSNFLEMGVGFGYIYCHLNRGKWKIFEMTKSKLKDLVKINSVKVRYPAKAKTVEVKIDCNDIIFNVQFRNRQGGIIPKSLLIQYKFKN